MVVRRYYPYWEWEEYQQGMWNDTEPGKEDELTEDALKVMRDDAKWGGFMQQVIDQWDISCGQNLSNVGMNRQAWVGQAAICIARSIPEHITRRAWGMLSQEERDAANARADKMIRIWERRDSVGRQMEL